MPKRKRTYSRKGSFKRRKFTRKRAPRKRYVPRGLRAVKRVVKHRYCEGVQVDPGASGTLGFYDFRANNLYDPNGTGTGHQPMFYDEMAQFYNHYVVLGAKITCKWLFTTTSATTGPLVVGCFLSDDTTTSTTDINTMTEQNRSSWRMIPTTYQVKPFTTTRKYSAKRFFNLKDVKDNLTRVGASTANTSGPLDQAHFMLFAGDFNNSGDPNPVNVYVMIDYIVAWSEPKEIGQS